MAIFMKVYQFTNMKLFLQLRLISKNIYRDIYQKKIDLKIQNFKTFRNFK